jgi:hypothetical protein
MIDSLWKSGFAACIAYGTHYSMTKLYSEVCTPDTIYGFFQGMVTSGSPICTSIFSLMSSTHITYSTIILASFSRICVDIFSDIPNCKVRKLTPKSKEVETTNN